jgi:hypothetical protein
LDLHVGSRTIVEEPECSLVEVTDEKGAKWRFPFGELSQPGDRGLGRFLSRVRAVIVGYCECRDVGFLRHVPNADDVWIKTPTVKDLSGLRHLPRLRSLALDRPTCRFDVLGELRSLRKLYLDGWRPGAESIFRLTELEDVGLQRFGDADLSRMAGWPKLERLWLNDGKLERLAGIPTSVRVLRLTSQRILSSLTPLGSCEDLEELYIERCRGIRELAGIEGCSHLRIFTVGSSGPIGSLAPLRGLTQLRYLALIEGSLAPGADVEALYGLPNLETVIVPKKSGTDPERIRRVSPRCDVRLTAV